MAATTTELMVRLVADTKGFAAELSGATRDIDALQAKAVRMGTAMQDVGRRMTLGFTLPFVAGMGLAVKAASDLNESANKVDVVFGKNAETIKRWAADSAKSFGMSRAAAFEAAGTFGNLFRSMDIALPSATKMSQGLVQLAADLASFNNANPEEVLIALRSGLVGEIEPLRKFGVSLSAARVEAKALELGLWDGNGAISAAAKAQAAYAIILEDTTLAQGDFARTSDGAANQMRIAQAQLTDAAASIGSVVLPIFADMVGVLADVADWFANLPGPVKTAIVVLGSLVAAAGPVLWVTGSMIKNVAVLRDQFPGLGSAAGKAGAALGALGVVLVGIELAKSTNNVFDLTNAVKNLSRAADDVQVKFFGAYAAMTAFTQGISFSKAQMVVFKETAQDNIGAAERLIENLQAAGFNTERFERALRNETEAQKQANADGERGAAILSGLGDEADGAATGIDALKRAFDDLTNAQFDVEGSAIRMEQAINDLNQSVLDGKEGTLEGRQAFLDAQRSVDDWGKAVYDNAIAAGKSTQDATDEQIWALGQVAGSLAPGSPLRVWLEEYIGRLSDIPRMIDTILSITTNADDTAQAVINSAGGWIFGRRAEGGPVANGMPYLVGERGPEIFVPAASGTIIPNHVAMGGGTRSVGGGPSSIVIPVHVGGRQVAEVVASELNRPGGPKITQKALVA